MKRELLAKVQALRSAGTLFVLITDLDLGTQHIFAEDEPLPEVAPFILEKSRLALSHRRSSAVVHEEARFFLQVFGPPLRLYLVGAVHIAQSLCEMATLTGFDVTVIEPRRAYAKSLRFGDIKISTEWPDDALALARIDHRCAVVTLAHDPKLDDPALCVALRSDAFYIGALGSRKTHANRLQRLRELSFDESDLERVHGPAGVSIGAISPAEISVSILAEIIDKLRNAAI